MDNLPIISGDSHAEEPSELFERLPKEYQQRAPRIEERPDGVYVIQEVNVRYAKTLRRVSCLRKTNDVSFAITKIMLPPKGANRVRTLPYVLLT